MIQKIIIFLMISLISVDLYTLAPQSRVNSDLVDEGFYSEEEVEQEKRKKAQEKKDDLSALRTRKFLDRLELNPAEADRSPVNFTEEDELKLKQLMTKPAPLLIVEISCLQNKYVQKISLNENELARLMKWLTKTKKKYYIDDESSGKVKERSLYLLFVAGGTLQLEYETSQDLLGALDSQPILKSA